MYTPEPFLPQPGEPKTDWRTWLSAFDMYMKVFGLSSSNIPQERKRAVLLQCLVLEGQRVFATLGVTETYAATREKLTEYFGGKKNVMVERFKFRQKSQRQGESVRKYVAALLELAATCRFGVMHDELIRDQLIERHYIHVLGSGCRWRRIL